MTGTLTVPVDLDGNAIFSDLKITGRGTGYTLIASSPWSQSAIISQPFTASAAVRFKIKLMSPAVAGQPFTVMVTALDSKGRVDPYYLGAVNLSAAGLSGQTSGAFSSFDQGKKSFSITLSGAGKLVLTVTDTLSAAVVGKLTVTVKAA
jgi:hypothetical protein